MKGSERVIEALNELLALELTVVNQYFLHSRMCESWGYRRLAKRFREISLEEMKDAERIIDRILFLEALPNMRIGPMTIGENVPEMFRIGLEGERQALAILGDGIKVSLEEGDDASREFFAGSLLDEEEHVDWLETELSLVERLAEANYLAQQIGD